MQHTSVELYSQFKHFKQESAFEIAVCKMVAILFAS